VNLKTIVKVFGPCPEKKIRFAFERYRQQESEKAGGRPPLNSLARAAGIKADDPRIYTDIRLAKSIIETKACADGNAVALKIAVHDPTTGGLQEKWLIGAKVPDFDNV
jgi:hypothetical protein